MSAEAMFRRALTLVLLMAVPPLSAQDRPLPDSATFLRQARSHLRDDWTLDRRYSYFERRTDYTRGSDGREQPKSVDLFEIVPSRVGAPYRRLIEVNGHHRTPDEIARDDRVHEQRLADRERQRQNETAAERQRRLRREQEQAREEQETWDDLSRVYTFTLTGRERVDGQTLVVVEFRPRPDAEPLTENGRRMMNVKGRAWISEEDSQVARIDAQVLDDIGIGWGLIGKLFSGSKASYVRRRVNGELWLPQQLSYSGAGRVLLVKRFTLDRLIEYFDYRKSD